MLDLLFRQNALQTNSFALCFGHEGGFMTLGGYRSDKHLAGEEIQRVKYYGNYLVHLKSVRVIYFYTKTGSKIVHETPKALSYFGLKAMFDTGTTHTFFPAYIHRRVMKELSTQCKKLGKDGCRGVKRFNQHTCVNIDLKKYKSVEEFFSVFPPITFEFQNGARLVWLAREYFHLKYDTTPAHYCMTFKIQIYPQTIFGNTLMRQYDIYFDRVNNEIHYVKAHCDNETVVSIKPYMNLGDDHQPPSKKRVLTSKIAETASKPTISLTSVGFLLAAAALTTWSTIHILKRRLSKH